MPLILSILIDYNIFVLYILEDLRTDKYMGEGQIKYTAHGGCE